MYLAAPSPSPSTTSGGGGLSPTFLIVIVVIVLLYWLLMRSMRRKQNAQKQEQQSMRNSLTYGTEVVTIGGLYGTVVDMDEDSVVLEISDGVVARYDRNAIARIISQGTSDEDGHDEDPQDAYDEPEEPDDEPEEPDDEPEEPDNEPEEPDEEPEEPDDEPEEPDVSSTRIDGARSGAAARRFRKPKS